VNDAHILMVEPTPIVSFSFETALPLCTGSNAATITTALGAGNWTFTRTGDAAVRTGYRAMVASAGGANCARVASWFSNGRQGLALSPARQNVWAPSDSVAGWVNGTGVSSSNVSGVTLPTGATGQVGSIDLTTCANCQQASRGIGGISSGTAHAMGVWARMKTGSAQIGWQDTQANPARSVLLEIDTNWQWWEAQTITAVANIGNGFIKVNTSPTDLLYIWGLNVVPGYSYSPDTIITPSSANTYNAERLNQTSAGAYLSNSGLSMQCVLFPAGRENQYPGAVRVITANNGDYVEISNTGLFTASVGGVTVTLPNAVQWASGRFDTRDAMFLFFEVGRGKATRAWIQTRLGVFSFGTGATLANFSWTSFDYMSNAGANVFDGLHVSVSAYADGDRPLWTNGYPRGFPYVKHDRLHGIVYGQSLADADNGGVALSTSQPYSNKMLSGGVQVGPGAGSGSSVQINGAQTLPLATINVSLGTALPAAGIIQVMSTNGLQTVTYTGRSAGTLTGCAGGTGTVADKAQINGPNTMGAFVPLIEGNIYSTGVSQETHASSFANSAAERAQNGAFAGVTALNFVMSSAAVGGQAYVNLQRDAGVFSGSFNGNMYYSDLIAQVREAKRQNDAAGLSSYVPFVTLTHGEADDSLNNTNYQANIQTLQRVLDQDIRAITGQIEPVYMIASQDSSWTKTVPRTTPVTAQRLWLASLAQPEIVIACPKYFLSYVADGIHIPNTQSIILGEYYEVAFEYRIINGIPWKPLQPNAAHSLGGGVYRIFFDVPVPPLVADTTHVSDPGNWGIEVDSGTITAKTVSGANTVDVTVTGTPTVFRFAWTGTSGNAAGPTTGARCNLVDSSIATRRSGTVLRNWCVTSEIAIT